MDGWAAINSVIYTGHTDDHRISFLSDPDGLREGENNKTENKIKYRTKETQDKVSLNICTVAKHQGLIHIYLYNTKRLKSLKYNHWR